MSHSSGFSGDAKEEETTWVRLGLPNIGLGIVPSIKLIERYPERLNPSIGEFSLGNYVIDD